MNKFGIIFCGLNQEEHVEESIAPFLDDDRFVVACVSVPFLEYKDDPFEDETGRILKSLYEQGRFKYFIDSPRFVEESHARNLAVSLLKEDGVDYYWIADADEKPTKEDLDRIIEFVENDSSSYWWSLSYKNYVFDNKHYLQEPFCPPRIFRREKTGCIFEGFYWDNCGAFNSCGTVIPYLSLKNKTIPKEIAWIKHYTWPNNEYGRRKVEYQKKHFKGICSFDWDKEKGLIFNEAYYQQLGLLKPIILEEE